MRENNGRLLDNHIESIHMDVIESKDKALLFGHEIINCVASIQNRMMIGLVWLDKDSNTLAKNVLPALLRKEGAYTFKGKTTFIFKRL